MEMTTMNCKHWKTNRGLNPIIKLIFILILRRLFNDLDFIPFVRIDFDNWEAEDFPRVLTRRLPLLPLLRPFISRSGRKASAHTFLEFSFSVHAVALDTQSRSSPCLERLKSSNTAEMKLKRILRSFPGPWLSIEVKKSLLVPLSDTVSSNYVVHELCFSAPEEISLFSSKKYVCIRRHWKDRTILLLIQKITSPDILAERFQL